MYIRNIKLMLREWSEPKIARAYRRDSLSPECLRSKVVYLTMGLTMAYKIERRGSLVTFSECNKRIPGNEMYYFESMLLASRL